MKSSLLSTREKLLLGLLCSSMVFSLSFSFSYGAVNQSKVNSIMDMVTAAASKFSDVIASGQSKSERTLYYEKVDAGLGDAVEMLAVVRNKIRSDFLGLSPAYTADEIVGQIIGGVIGNPGTGNPGTGGGNMNPMALCSTDSTLETIAWPHPTRGSYNPLMSVTDTKSKVFKFTVPTGGTSMTISYASTPTNTGKRIQKLYYTLSKQKACTYGDTSIGWSNTLQGGGTLNFLVSSENTSGPYTGNPKLTPGETYYLSFKAQQPLTSDIDKNAPFDLIVEGGTSGSSDPSSSGNGVFIYRVKTATSQDALNKAQADNNALQCISSLDELRRINPDTIGPNNPNGYEYATFKGIGKDCYFNVKDHNNVKTWSKNPEIKNRSENIPDSCRIGTKFVAWAKNGIVLAECVSKEYAYGIGKTAPNCTDDANAVVFDLNKMRGNTTFTIETLKDLSGKDILVANEGSYAKGTYPGIRFVKGGTSTPPVVSIRIDLRDGKFDPNILPKKITEIAPQYQNDDYPTYGASSYILDKKYWQHYDQMHTELASLSQCAGDFTSSEARLLGGYRSDTPVAMFSSLIMGQLDHPNRKLQLLEGGPQLMNDTKDVFLQPGSVWYLNYRVQYGYSRAAPFTIPLKEDGTPYPSDAATWPFGAGPTNIAFGMKPCSVPDAYNVQNSDIVIRGGCLAHIEPNTFQSFFSNVPGNTEWLWSTTSK